MPGPKHDPKPQWNPHAAVAGWLIPGLGHWILGMRRRGVVLCIAIVSLWLSGILIGGVSVIDREDRAEGPNRNYPERGKGRSMWFFGQALIAPTILIDRVRENMYNSFGKERNASPKHHSNVVLTPSTRHPVPPYEPSIARVAEQGTLFTALAGLLNLLAMIDVLYCDPKYRRERDANSQPEIESASKVATPQEAA